jgi:CheY-like chemotaxis protein
MRSQQETADIPIVVLGALASAEGGGEDEPSASRVAKPVNTDVLLAALRDALGGGAHHALVVEDDALLAEVLRAELVRRGLEVRRAGSRAEALCLGRALRPDLLLLDLALPDGDGIGIVEWLRDQHWASTVAVLVYSAFDLGKEDRARVCVGETRVLTKGRTSPSVFEAELDELLEWVERRSVPR